MSQHTPVEVGCAMPAGAAGTAGTLAVTLSPGADTFAVSGAVRGSPSGERPARRLGERVQAAVAAAGWRWPSGSIEVAVNPQPDRRAMWTLDLAAAAGVLAASRQIPAQLLEGCVLVGTLDVSGGLRESSGSWLGVDAVAHRAESGPVVTDPRTARWFGQAAAQVRPLERLDGLAAVIEHGAGVGTAGLPRDLESAAFSWPPDRCVGLGRVAAAAAGGGHHVLVEGSFGLRGRRLAAAIVGVGREILPQGDRAIARAHAAAGVDPVPWGLLRRPHSRSETSAVLGAWSQAGEVTAAHGGVLFLEDLHDFAPSTIDGLVAGVERGHLSVVGGGARDARSWPADALVVAQAGLCACGKARRFHRCVCAPGSGAHHWRNSGEIMRLGPLRLCGELSHLGAEWAADFDSAAERARMCRDRAHARGAPVNAKLSPPQLSDAVTLTDDAAERVDSLVRAGWFTGRGIHATVAAALTLCDLEAAAAVVDLERLGEALELRGVDAVAQVGRDRAERASEPPGLSL